MGIHRLNHAVLYVRDVARTVAFYEDVLGFAVTARMGEQAAFLRAPASANDHDVAFFGLGADAGDSTAGRGAVGLYHLAWEVDSLDDLEEHLDRLAAAGALVGTSDHGTTKSLYAKDPDGIEMEIVWLVPAHLIDERARAAANRIGRLDLVAEKARYGGQTRGGLGISIPLEVPAPA